MRKCDRAGCLSEAGYEVVLLLRPKNYKGPPVRGTTGIVVCDGHREKLPDPFITQESWNDILADFDRRGIVRPHRILTDVAYVPIEAGPAEETVQ